MGDSLGQYPVPVELAYFYGLNLYQRRVGVHELTDEEVLMEWAACEAVPGYWLKEYARIVDTPTATNAGGIKPFSLWPHVVECWDTFEHERLISALKARQIGLSWIVSAWVLWNVMAKPGATWLLFSKGEIEAIELLAKCYRIYDSLPPWMKFPLEPKSKTELGFPHNKSVIRAFAATEAAGVSFTASGIVCDEHEYHPYAEQNYINAKPTIDAGGQFISIFTVDKMRPNTLAKAVFKGAPNNGFKSLFFPFDVRPGRDEKWYEATRASIPAEELQGLTPDLYMEQNYPRTIEEALRPTQTVAAVDLKVLDEMKKRCTAPVVIEGLDPLICHVYQGYQVGNFYVAASDTSHGVGKDYNCTVIMNVKTGAIVADVFNNTMKPDEFTYYSVELLKHFRNPKWFIEDNDWGATTIDNARKLSYPNFGYQDEKRTKIGWHTGATNRTLLFANLVSTFNSWGLQIFNFEGLTQFGFLIRNMEKEGRVEAMKGKNDDYPTAVAICVAKAGEVLTAANYTYTPIRTLHFAPPQRRYAGARR